MQLESLLGQYAGRPVSSAVGRYAVNLCADGFAELEDGERHRLFLKPEAKCSVTIAKKADPCKVALQVDSADTTDVQLPPADGMTYVNIDLDFDINRRRFGKWNRRQRGNFGKSVGLRRHHRILQSASAVRYRDRGSAEIGLFQPGLSHRAR